MAVVEPWNLWNAIRRLSLGGSRNTGHISLISDDLVTADRVVAETEVVGRGSVIRRVCHCRSARLVHHAAFLGPTFALPASEHLPTVSAHRTKKRFEADLVIHLICRRLRSLSAPTPKMFTRALVASSLWLVRSVGVYWAHAHSIAYPTAT
jgi:hypothetical protein